MQRSADRLINITLYEINPIHHTELDNTIVVRSLSRGLLFILDLVLGGGRSLR